MVNKRKKNVSYNSIRNINEDWSLDERNGYPYSGQSVQEFIKNVFNSKAGEFYYDGDTVRYLVFANSDDRDLYLSNREEYSTLLLASFDAPANYTAEITLTTPSSNAVLEGATGNYVDFTFDVINKSGGSTGEPVIVNYSINNSGNVKRITQVYNAGTNVHFLVDDYLSTGVNTISIIVTGRNTLASVMASVTYTVISLKISSDFNFTTPIEQGDLLSLTYTLEGAGVKYLQWYIDGVQDSYVDTVSDIKVTRTKNLSLDGILPGKHTIQVRPYTTIGGTNFYGKTLYFDFVLCPQNENWDIQTTHLTYTLLGLELDQPATSIISVTTKQYIKIYYKLGLYDYRRRSLDVTIEDNGAVVQTIGMDAEDIVEKDYVPFTSGTHILTFDAGENESSFTVSADVNDIGVREETEDVILKLSAKGRNNNEVNPARWVYNNISTTFEGINWNEQDGWIDDALVIPIGGSISIPLAILGNNPVNTGRTVEIEYEVADVDNDDASVLSLIDDQTGAGLEITATSAKLQSSGGAQINTKFRDGDRLRLSFIINRTTGDNGRLMFIVNNGILERVANFAATDDFNVSDNIVIGSNGCVVKIYNILVYNKALTIEQAFGNYAINTENFLDVVDRNDILNDTTGRIDADKVNAKIPILIITGDMQPIFDATDKKATTYVDVEYINLQDTSKNFTATHLRMRPQGTSSLGYPRKNLRLYTSDEYGCTMKDSNGDVIPNGKYAFKDNAQPVDCWTLKADYAESSGSHNTGIARIWNKLMYDCQVNNTFPLRTQAQTTALVNGYNKDVRTAIDGFPIVVFHRVTSESEMTCLGQYNFNNDKSTESVFGFVNIPGFDNSHVQCFEVLGNEEPLALFTDVEDFDTDWDKAYESRYPDTSSPDLTALKSLCTWVNSCKNNQSIWNTEKEDHFDLYKLAAYYVYLMRFGAVDQAVKNSMLTTEDGTHWFFINYDNDTVLGIDNISTVLNRWDYDRTTSKVGGGYIYAGHESVLWNCFEADSECMALVKTIDDALYTAGLTYNNLINMFDVEQCDKWCERIYNDNGDYKYIAPFKEKGSAVLYMLQGNRKSYRHWWMKNRMEMFDAMWGTAAYKNRVVRFIAEGAPSGSTFTIGAAKSSYFGYGINAVEQETGVQIDKNDTYTFEISQALAIGDPVNIYNANNINEVDLSDVCQYLTTLYLQQAVDNEGKSFIKRLILGDGITTNIKFSEIGGLSVSKSLEEIDIRGMQAMNNIELSSLKNLHIFKALGSGITSFSPAEGCTLNNIQLPDTIQSIVLNKCNVSNNFTIEGITNLRNVIIQDIVGTFDTKSFITNWVSGQSDENLANFSITLSGIEWTGVSVNTLLSIGKIGTKNLRGSITITSMTETQYATLIELFGSSAFQSYSQFRIIAPEGIYLTGPASLKHGQTGQFVGSIVPATEAPMKYLLYSDSTTTTPITPQTDEQGRIYRQYDVIRLYEDSGIVYLTANPNNNIQAYVAAQKYGTAQQSIRKQFTAKYILYPSSITINGNDSIDRNGTYNYTKIINGGNSEYELSNISWSIEGNGIAELSPNTTSETAVINVFNTSATAVDIVLTCTATFNNNVTRTSSKTISVQLSYPSGIIISGDNTINQNGDCVYTKTIIDNNYSANLISVVWSLTASEYITITSFDNNQAVVSIPNGNPSQTGLTLSCTCTFQGNVFRTATKSITVAQIDPPKTEETFYVLVNNQWVVPSSGISIKVGNTDASYRGNGLWFVSLDDISATDNVYVGGRNFGTIGDEIYTDGSGLTTQTYTGTMPSSSIDRVGIKNIPLQSLPCYIASVQFKNGQYIYSCYQSVGLNNTELDSNFYTYSSFPVAVKITQVRHQYLYYNDNYYNDGYNYLILGCQNGASSGYLPPQYTAVVNYINYPALPSDSETI